MLITPDFLLKSYKESGHKTSWDIIAICASDSDQAYGYRLLGEDRFKKKLRIFSDPPGPKIGNGGALLHCLSQLREEFGDDRLCKLRVLFVPAGGMSQRSPWLACLGKLFAVLPTSSAGCLDMLDIVVAMSEPFAKFAADAGVGCFYLACSDVLLPLEFESASLLPTSASSRRLAKADFVALAHPTNDLALASGHGVYCAEQTEPAVADEDKQTGLAVLNCCRVLQKPTIDEMQSTVGLIDPANGSVLIDSNFWFNGDALKALLCWRDANELSMVGLELDAYGDLLRCLGRDAQLGDYANEIRNLTRPPSPSTVARLAQLRASLFKLLRNQQLKLCRIERSALVHIGSTREYLSALFEPIDLARCFTNVTLNSGSDNQKCIITRCRLNIAEGAQFSVGSVLEFCDISSRSCRIGTRCLLSHCRCSEPSAELIIPDGWVMQTVPLLSGWGHVTWALHSGDNPKQRNLNEATFLGKSLTEFFNRHGLSPEQVWMDQSSAASAASSSSSSSSARSLWTARLFPCDRTWSAEDRSLLTTLNALRLADQSTSSACGLCLRLGDWLVESPQQRRLMSLAEIAQEKDTKAMVEFRMSFND